MIAERIVAAAELSPGDEVVEIGPGLGILSERIAARDIARLTLVELDRELAARLKQRFAGDSRVRVVQADFMRADLNEIFERPRVKVVGNLPFNVASAIFRRLCDAHQRISTMVLMFQREVGERMRAAQGSRGYSALSVFAALYWRIDLHFRVVAGNFFPRPKVDAEVLRLRARSHLLFAPGEESAVAATVRACFSSPRKKIRNSLATGLGIEPREASAYLDSARIDGALRPESLCAGDFVRLARTLVEAGALSPETMETRDA
jgi:16S rRNA (adenine1518-N6/adenine1519-N6)-dimethyltransferase